MPERIPKKEKVETKIEIIKNIPLFYKGQEPDDSSHCIVIGKNGAFFKVSNHLYSCFTDIKDKKFSFLDDIETDATVKLPKVSLDIYSTILKFFRAVYKEHSSEAGVLLVMNLSKPVEEQEYKIVVPEQEVSGAHIDYKIKEKDIDLLLEEGEILVGSFHSHPNFGASQSNVDAGDELNFDGLHVTLGYITRDEPEIHARFCFHGQTYISKSNWIQKRPKGLDYTFPKEWLEKVKKPVVKVYTCGVNNAWSNNYSSQSGVDYKKDFWYMTDLFIRPEKINKHNKSKKPVIYAIV